MEALPNELKLSILQSLVEDSAYQDALSLTASEPGFLAVFQAYRNTILSSSLNDLSRLELICCHLLAKQLLANEELRGLKALDNGGIRRPDAPLSDLPTGKVLGTKQALLAKSAAPELWAMIRLSATIREMTVWLSTCERDSPLGETPDPRLNMYLHFTLTHPGLYPLLLASDEQITSYLSLSGAETELSGPVESNMTLVGGLIHRNTLKMASRQLIAFEEMYVLARGAAIFNMYNLESRRNNLRNELLFKVREAQKDVLSLKRLVRESEGGERR